ncbi:MULTISPECIES: GNAT family N-acetyltransferase [Rhodomicrobium]|uniref:GNAT family N-acetyltransferase n=1 Tax=Rhodomicrobium TaxID=1068 RepID=UPI000B4B43C8|nr:MULTISPECIES: GNAT family N-acetyltransferase [Rhodomicrobium]
MQNPNRAAIAPEAVRSLDQLVSMWEVIVADRGDADLRALPGFTVRWADNRFGFWNTLVFTEMNADRKRAAAILAEASAYMRGKRQSGLIWVCQEYLTPPALEELPAIAAEAGLAYALTCHGMEGDFLPIPEPSHAELSFVRASTENLMRAYGEINAAGYGWGPDVGHEGLGNSPLWKDRMQSWLGLADGVPVSAAATIANQGCLFVALVATAPAEQRKGYGEATTRKALYEGFRATGLTRAVLHATDAGMPVYRRIGFQKVATFQCFGLA